jgi:integral membrane sensor domain MASE1
MLPTTTEGTPTLVRRSSGLVQSGLAAAVGIVYFLAARQSLLLLTKPDGVAVFWPASGVAAGVLIALGPRARLPVAAGAMVATIVANLMGDRTLLSSVVFALCNAGEALLTAWLIERFFGSGFNLGKLSHVLGMLVCAIAATAVSGMGVTAGFLYFHSSDAPILTIWQHWFGSDALGIITVAPLIIQIASAARQPPSRRGIVEGAAALVALVILSGFVIFLPQGFWGTVVPVALLFPMLLWLAARCHPVFAATAAFISALTIVLSTTFGIGFSATPASRSRAHSGRTGEHILAVSFAYSYLLRCLPNDACTRLNSWRAARGAARALTRIAAIVRKRSDRSCVSHSGLPLSGNQSPPDGDLRPSIADPYSGKSVANTVPQVAEQVESLVRRF